MPIRSTALAKKVTPVVVRLDLLYLSDKSGDVAAEADPFGDTVWHVSPRA